MANLSHQYADQTRSPFLSGHGAKNILVAELAITEDNLGSGARWDFFKVPADAIVSNVYLYASELDDGTTLTLTIKAEDEKENAIGTLLSADTVGQTGGWVAADTSLPILTDGDDYYIFVEVGTGAGTAVDGNAKLVVEYFRTRT